MKVSYKKWSILVVILVLGCFLMGCQDKGKDTETSKGIDSKESVKTRIIVDAAGREVEIPNTVKKVIPVANALRMMCYAQAQDLIAGVEEGEKTQTLVKAYNYINYEGWKDLPIIGDGGSGGYTPYEEEMVTVNPDVIIGAYSQEDAQALQEKTGIPVVVIYSGTLFEDDYDESLRIIGTVCGKEERCEEVIRYIQSVQDDLNNRTKDIKEEEKPTVYAGAVSYCGGHGIEGTYQNFPPFLAINAKNVYESTGTESTGVVIDPEMILSMDPDIIFLDPNNRSFVEEDYKKNKDFYESLQAVKNGNVYSMLGYNWYYTNVEIAMADCYYAASMVYPEQFEDIDPEEKAEEIFDFMLGAPDYYNELKENGFGFSSMVLGDIDE